MLRIGKNPKDQEDHEHANEKQEVSGLFNSPKTTPPIRDTAEAKPAATDLTAGSAGDDRERNSGA